MADKPHKHKHCCLFLYPKKFPLNAVEFDMTLFSISSLCSNSGKQISLPLRLFLSHKKVNVTGLQVKCPKMGQNLKTQQKKKKNGPYHECYFIQRLHTWYQGTTNKVHSTTEVTLTLTFGQGQRSRSNFHKWVKN